MCVSAAPAQFTGTILYLGRHQHPQHGPVEVLGYQNTAASLVEGPNAMLLHLPASEMSQGNFLDTSDHPDVLRDMVAALEPAAAGAAPGRGVGQPAAGAVEVFDHDVYTVVLAADPRDIPAALERVPEHKRPQLAPELFAFYAETFPLYPVALCCFDNADARRAAPLLMWYRPIYSGRMTAPALDSHTGAAPDPQALVDVDHWVVVGVDDEAPAGVGMPVSYQRDPGPLAPFLPRRVIGRHVDSAQVRNGDFAISTEDAQAGRIGGLVRITTDGRRIPLSTPTLRPASAPPPEPVTPGRSWLRPLLLAAILTVVVVVCGWVLVFGP